MAQNRTQHLTVDRAIGIASAELDQRSDDCQTAQPTELIGVIDNTRLQGPRLLLTGSKDRRMGLDNTLHARHQLILCLKLAQKLHSHLRRFYLMIVKPEFNR